MSRKFINVEGNIHKIKLQQLGAKVEVIQGIMYFVQMDIEDTNLKYVYHINDKGDYFIQRRAPYPINLGTYSSHEDVVNIIKHDILQMKNAKRSKKFDKFIDINKTLNEIAQNFEDLYLYYNVSGVQAKKFDEKIEELKKLIKETKDQSKRVYFEKEPDSI
ncbi:hypothetical protein [Anaerophilus nitritogenes]|uniref:hypothetical protein n=1 Tax=Anaerophilus nitritogenes TaxID=2498136 RepID=UPI001FAAFAB5|nr:hypothetical protein [Anaerophilus nitritogenes]